MPLASYPHRGAGRGTVPWRVGAGPRARSPAHWGCPGADLVQPALAGLAGRPLGAIQEITRDVSDHLGRLARDGYPAFGGAQAAVLTCLLPGRITRETWETPRLVFCSEGFVFLPGRASIEQPPAAIAQRGVVDTASGLMGNHFLLIHEKATDTGYAFIDRSGAYDTFYTRATRATPSRPRSSVWSGPAAGVHRNSTSRRSSNSSISGTSTSGARSSRIAGRSAPTRSSSFEAAGPSPHADPSSGPRSRTMLRRESSWPASPTWPRPSTARASVPT
jgi:hypothetical protein